MTLGAFSFEVTIVTSIKRSISIFMERPSRHIDEAIRLIDGVLGDMVQVEPVQAVPFEEPEPSRDEIWRGLDRGYRDPEYRVDL